MNHDSPRSADIVFYDGTCGMCHGFVRFMLARDAAGMRFRFAPLQGATVTRLFTEAQREGLPDSVVVLTPNGSALVRSEAVQRVLERLGGVWTVPLAISRVLPRAVMDACYDAIARMRKRIFKKPPDACPIVPPEWRSRFLP
jgi:predicted DCC family thiol-disulfide oxidoreductase YuxK